MPQDFASEFLISLPQTAIRMWGLDYNAINNVKLIETPTRTKQDFLLNSSNHIINKLIISEIGSLEPQFIEKKALSNLIINQSIVDCNILNLIHHYPKIESLSNVRILDYSSLGHRTLLKQDIRNIRESARAIKRNLNFKRKFSPNIIIHWDDYALNRKESLISFGWKNYFVDTAKIKATSKVFMANNIKIIPEIHDLTTDSKILLIAPHVKSREEELIHEINVLLESNEVARDAFEESEIVLIKQHRTSVENYKDIYKIKGKKYISLQSSISRAIPIEIYLHGFSRVTLLSAPSSVIYSHSSRSFLLDSKLTQEDLAEYGLMSYRHLKTNTMNGMS